MDITFTISDNLPEGSSRVLMQGLWGEITLKYDPNDQRYHISVLDILLIKK
jgi:hypothetical protein